MVLSRAAALASAMLVLGGCTAFPNRGGSPPAPPAASPAGKVRVQTNSIGMKLAYVPGGTFRMGDPRAALDAGPVHSVTVSGFWIGQYEVTNDEFDQFRKRSRFAEAPGPSHPATRVNWMDADAFCRWLSRREGKPYRLPTEAEWEFAARGGLDQRDYPWGNESPDRRANVAALATAPVGSFPPNAFGLHDMAGNGTEYVLDWYDEGYYARSPARDSTGPSAPVMGRFKVQRDGPFGAWEPRTAGRMPTGRYWRIDSSGFRVVQGALPRVPPATLKASPPVVPPRPLRPEFQQALQRDPTEALTLALNQARRLWTEDLEEAMLTALRQGAAVDASSDDGYTALMMAVIHNDPEFVRQVLRHKPNVNAQNAEGKSALILALDADPDLYPLLFARNPDLELRDQNGATALIWAASKGRIDVLRLLLSRGARLQARDNEGNSALYVASRWGDPEVIRFLQRQGLED